MKLKINISETFELVNDRLGALGKRMKSQNGEPLYIDLVLSSREKPTLAQYITEAVHNIRTAAPERVSDYHKDRDDILFSIQGGRDADNLTEFFTDFSQNYVTAYCVYRHLSDTHPEIAKSFADTASFILLSLRTAVFTKSGFLSSSDPLADTKGSVTKS